MLRFWKLDLAIVNDARTVPPGEPRRPHVDGFATADVDARLETLSRWRIVQTTPENWYFGVVSMPVAAMPTGRLLVEAATWRGLGYYVFLRTVDPLALVIAVVTMLVRRLVSV